MTAPAIGPAPPTRDEPAPPGGAGLVGSHQGGVDAEHSVTDDIVRMRVIALAINDPSLAAEQLACALHGRARAITYLREMIGGLVR